MIEMVDQIIFDIGPIYARIFFLGLFVAATVFGKHTYILIHGKRRLATQTGEEKTSANRRQATAVAANEYSSLLRSMSSFKDSAQALSTQKRNNS